MTLLVRCSWCHKNMGTVENKSWNGLTTNTTHSICPECYNIWINDIEFPKSNVGVIDDNHDPYRTLNKST